jgi:hypothetical protein
MSKPHITMVSQFKFLTNKYKFMMGIPFTGIKSSSEEY